MMDLRGGRGRDNRGGPPGLKHRDSQHCQGESFEGDEVSRLTCDERREDKEWKTKQKTKKMEEHKNTNLNLGRQWQRRGMIRRRILKKTRVSISRTPLWLLVF